MVGPPATRAVEPGPTPPACAGIRTVILPQRNKRDLEEVDPQVRKKLHFVFADNVDHVPACALGRDRINRVLRTKTAVQAK